MEVSCLNPAEPSLLRAFIKPAVYWLLLWGQIVERGAVACWEKPGGFEIEKGCEFLVIMTMCSAVRPSSGADPGKQWRWYKLGCLSWARLWWASKDRTIVCLPAAKWHSPSRCWRKYLGWPNLDPEFHQDSAMSNLVYFPIWGFDMFPFIYLTNTLLELIF